jgi:mono/diheme cytochrome c family protein
MRFLSRWRNVAAVVVAGAAVVVVSASAFGHGAVNVSAGEKLFTTSGCGGCHTFKAMGAKGTIGPNLDKVVLTLALWKTAISKGGSAVMTPAALKKYKFKMAPYAGRLSTAKIATLAAFVLAERNKPQLAGTATTTTAACPVPGDCSGSGGGTTTTRQGSGGGGGNASGCAPGVTIQTSGQTDADGDEVGTEADDNDGCI